MAKYDVAGGQLSGAPASTQSSWDQFNRDKAPTSSAKYYRDQYNSNPAFWDKEAEKHVFKMDNG